MAKNTRKARKSRGPSRGRRLAKPRGNAYVRRTLDILDDGAKKAARLRKQKAKELRGVWADLYEEVQSEGSRKVETFSKRFRKLPVVQDVAQIPEQLSDALDRGLDRMGLVRKSAAKPRRRKRRRAA